MCENLYVYMEFFPTLTTFKHSYLMFECPNFFKRGIIAIMIILLDLWVCLLSIIATNKIHKVISLEEGLFEGIGI